VIWSRVYCGMHKENSESVSFTIAKLKPKAVISVLGSVSASF
jgi:hypothetical protein